MEFELKLEQEHRVVAEGVNTIPVTGPVAPPDMALDPEVVEDVPRGAVEPARRLNGGGRFDGGSPGSRSKVLFVPDAALHLAARGALHCRPRRRKVLDSCRFSPLPFLSCDSGLPADSGCAARGVTRFGSRE